MPKDGVPNMFKKGAEKTKRMKEKLAAKTPKRTHKKKHHVTRVRDEELHEHNTAVTAAEQHRLAAEKEANDNQDKARGTGGRRRRTVRTIRMKKGEYLREHHHLFRVLRNPTRRALNAELRAQQKELRERGLKG